MAPRTPSAYSDIPLRNSFSNPLRNHLRNPLGNPPRNPLPDPLSRPGSTIERTSDLMLPQVLAIAGGEGGEERCGTPTTAIPLPATGDMRRGLPRKGTASNLRGGACRHTHSSPRTVGFQI